MPIKPAEFSACPCGNSRTELDTVVLRARGEDGQLISIFRQCRACATLYAHAPNQRFPDPAAAAAAHAHASESQKG